MSAHMRKNLNMVAGLLGAALCVAGMWYLIQFVRSADIGPHIAAIDRQRLVALAGLTASLAVANTLIAMGWRAILADCGGEISAVRAQLLFSWTNLGKYVPGNVLHLLGRQMLVMREGVAGGVAAKSLAVETALLVLTACVFAGTLWLSIWAGGWVGGLMSFALFIFVVVCVMLLRYFGFDGSARASIAYCVYHLSGGVVFALLFLMLGDTSVMGIGFEFVVMAYVASWVLGSITPGAPAGLGVREAVLIGLLHHGITDPAILGMAVLLSRGMNVVADLVYFLALQSWQLACSCSVLWKAK